MLKFPKLISHSGLGQSCNAFMRPKNGLFAKKSNYLELLAAKCGYLSCVTRLMSHSGKIAAFTIWYVPAEGQATMGWVGDRLMMMRRGHDGATADPLDIQLPCKKGKRSSSLSLGLHSDKSVRTIIIIRRRKIPAK